MTEKLFPYKECHILYDNSTVFKSNLIDTLLLCSHVAYLCHLTHFPSLKSSVYFLLHSFRVDTYSTLHGHLIPHSLKVTY